MMGDNAKVIFEEFEQYLSLDKNIDDLTRTTAKHLGMENYDAEDIKTINRFILSSSYYISILLESFLGAYTLFKKVANENPVVKSNDIGGHDRAYTHSKINYQSSRDLLVAELKSFNRSST